MNLKRTLTLGAGCAVLAALLASAATSGNHRVMMPPPPKTTEVETSGAALAAEIARLHDRLHPTVVPQQPVRNLFQYTAARAPRAVVAESTSAIAPVVPVENVVPLQTATPSLKLVGIAEDAGADGPVRTAIVSGFGELFLAKEGEAVTLRYRVAHIAGDLVELADVNDGSILRLSLK